MTDKYKAYHKYSRAEMKWLKAKGEWNDENKRKDRQDSASSGPFSK